MGVCNRSEELTRDMRKKQAEIQRETEEAAIAAERAIVSGPGRAWLELQEKARKATKFVDSKGIERQLRLTHGTQENLEREHRARLLMIQKESVNQTLDLYRQEYEERLKNETELYQERLKNDIEIAARNLEHSREMYETQEARATIARDAQLRHVEAGEARTIEQKVAIEQRKMGIEIEYLERTHEIKMRLFDLETSRMALEEESHLRRLGYRADEVNARIAELTVQREQVRQHLAEQTDAAIDAAREGAAIRQTQMIRDHNRQIFDSFKRQAEGVFDALLSKSQSIWSAIGNSLKTALLTAIKEVVTSRVAAMLMQMFGGGRAGYQPGNSSNAGRAGALGGFGAIFGSGGGGPVPSGAVGGWGAPPFIPQNGTPATAGGGSALGFGSMAAGYKGFLSGLGNIGFRPERWRMDEMGNMTKLAGARGVGGWQSGALLAGGGLLAMEGIRRGGWSGMGMTTAGGAMIGAKFGGPIGAVIGGAIGAAAGFARLFMKGATQKAREKIKATYGVNVSDKKVLQQIVEMAKSGYGGNLDMAIRAQDVRDLIGLYAMSTGQRMGGASTKVRPLDLMQSGGSLLQSGGMSSGAPLGGFPVLDRIGGGVPSGASAIVIQLDGPATTSLLRGEAAQAIVENPRAVQSAAMKAPRSNAGRREMASLQMSPGLLTA